MWNSSFQLYIQEVEVEDGNQKENLAFRKKGEPNKLSATKKGLT